MKKWRQETLGKLLKTFREAGSWEAQRFPLHLELSLTLAFLDGFHGVGVLSPIWVGWGQGIYDMG
jgi:hypothetical protein